MTDTKKALLDYLKRYTDNCIKYRGKLDANTLKDYMGIGGCTFHKGIVSHDAKGIRYEDFERNGNLKFSISYSEVVDHAKGIIQEQVALF